MSIPLEVPRREQMRLVSLLRAVARRRAPILVALIALGAHLLVAQNYGYFRDELYYLAAGRHLDWGYVDFQPFIAALATALHALALDSLLGIHLLPALACALVVGCTGQMSNQLGGGAIARVLAPLATLVTFAFLASGSIFSMDVFDQLWWTLALLVLLRILRDGPEHQHPRLWLAFGALAGLGVFTKLTMLYLGLAVVIGLALTSQRRHFRSRWPWLGGLITAAFLVPTLLWEQAHGWPSLAFWHAYADHPDSPSIVVNLLEDVVIMNPLNLLLVVLGVRHYFSRGQERYRAIGWMFVVLLVVFTLEHAKPYFLASMYPALYAAGAVVFERFVQTRPWRVRSMVPGYATLLLASGLLLAPLAMPILPPETYIATYGRILGAPDDPHHLHAPGQFPQWLSDRFEWDRMVASVAQVYRSLPPDEQASTCILTINYGEAGAFDQFSSAYHLPRAISGHNNYFVWGPGACSGQTVIAIGFDAPDDLRTLTQSFANITPAGTFSCVYCALNEDNASIYVCRQATTPLRDAWPRFRHFNR